MAATTYDPQNIYAKHLSTSCDSEGCSSSSPCSSCSCEEEDTCGCCPPGLVSVTDLDGQNIGCMTPNDAELFIKNTRSCKEGYVALYSDAGTKFLGCVSETEFAALYAAVNP